jgi:adenylate cyclase
MTMDERGLPTPLTTTELAARSAVTVEWIAELTEKRVLRPVGPDAYDPGDLHRIRALAAFEAAGISVDALLTAGDDWVTFDSYDQLHEDPGEPSARDYAAFAATLGPAGERLPALFAAFGLAEPRPGSRLAVDEERFIAQAVRLIDAVPEPDAALQAVRLFADAARRTAESVTAVYAAIQREAYEEGRGLPPGQPDPQRFLPWAPFARWVPDLARFLTSRHLSHAIDAYSVEQTEALLAERGIVPARSVVPPAVAFVDLAGFTELAHRAGDDAAASVALRFSALASSIASDHGGRLVKALGDGVLLTFPDAVTAVEGSLGLLAALPGADLPSGHGGVHAGPIIERHGDVFGRTVNLAARVGDQAPAGSLWVTRPVVIALAERSMEVVSVGVYQLHGLGARELWRVIGAEPLDT